MANNIALHQAYLKQLEKRRIYLKEHPEIREKKNQYRRDHPEKRNAQKAKYAATENGHRKIRDKERRKNQKRRAMKRGLESSLTGQQWEDSKSFFNGCCAYCGCEITMKEMQIDHLESFYNGGNDEIDNLLPSCRQCNFNKSTFSLEVYREYVKGLLNRILDRSFVVRIAIKYGMLSINEWDGKFYFEKQDEVK